MEKYSILYSMIKVYININIFTILQYKYIYLYYKYIYKYIVNIVT